jgi:hypothetical protein
MSCVNINDSQFKELVKGLSNREKFVAKAVISRFMTENQRFPDLVELKSAISDLYNTNKGGIDYQTFYNEVRGLVKSLLPSLSDKEIDKHVKFVDKLELMRLRNGKEVLGTFIDNIIYLDRDLAKDQDYNTVRHEVFHIIFNNFLSDQEQENMIETFKRWKPQYASLMDKEEIEEAISNEFENYRDQPRKSIPIIIRDFFLDILKFLGFISNNYTDITKLFSDVNNGKFTRNYLRDSLVTRDKDVLSKYTEFSTDLDLFLQSKAFLLNNLNELMFPEESRNLSEVNNKNLFLNEDYNSPLFQNNKEIFKLGLTKNDALKQLQKRIKALKDTKSIDPQLSRVIEVLSKDYILKDFFDYIQPYSLAEVSASGELQLKNQIQEDPTESLLESDEDYNSLEIGSKELINPVTKISEVVKDFLSSITYETSPGNFVNIDPGTGFIALLNLLGSIYGNTSIEDNLESLRASYNDTVKGSQTKAVYNKLKDLHESLQGSDRVILNTKGMTKEQLDTLSQSLMDSILEFETFKDTITIIIPDNMKIENQGTNSVDNRVVFTYNRFKEGDKSYLIEQSSKESNKTFIEKISNETGIPNFIISKLFKYNEQRNQLAELTKVAGSLRKLSPKFVKVQTSRVEVDGVAGNVTSYSFINKVNDYRSSSSMSSILRDRFDIIDLRNDVLESIDRYKTLKDKGNKTDLRKLLQDIIVNKLNVISISDFQKISDRDVLNLLNSLERIPQYVPDIRSDKRSDEFDNSDTYLKQTSNFSNSLTKYTFEKNNPTSFTTSTSNKQKWENVMPNSSVKLFTNLQNFSNGSIKASNLLGFFKNSFNNYLKYNPIFDHNYSEGQMSVNQNILKTNENDFYSDHQETYFENKASSFDRMPIPFGKESPRDWINRNFLAMFQLPILEALTSGRKTEKSMSYYQQKFQPESAPNVSVVKMGVNSAEQLRTSIANMILQEAYMNHLSGVSGRGNILKNTKKSLLPGLEGSSYFIKNKENIFFDGAGNLNPEFGSIVNDKLVINLENKELSRLVDTIINTLDNSLDEFVDLALTEKATLEGTQLIDMYDKIKNSYLDNYKLTNEEIDALRSFYVDAKTDIADLRNAEIFQVQRQALKKVMSSYYLNSFANGFFMNQISSGATQNYKNPLDEVKRQAGVNAMHDTGLIDNKHGMKNNYKNIVISAANNFYGASHKFAEIPVLQRFFRNKKQEVGDAQSWDLPEYKQMLRKSFGKSVDIGVITKDVHFEVNSDGYVDYRKTSSAELTNELVKNNKTLRDLRYALTFEPYLSSLNQEDRAQVQERIDYLYNKMIDNGNIANRFNGLRDNIDEYMEYQDLIQDIQDKDLMIHKASFESAVKGSKPSRMSSFVKDKETGTFNFVLEPTSILNLNSAYNGIQQAIRHKYIDSHISHFTQLTYLIGLNRTDTSIKNNRSITRTLSKFAKSGIYDSLFDYRMSYDKENKTLRVNNRSKKEFVKDLLKKLDLPGNERIVNLLRTPKISMNNPLFSEKLMQNFFNSFSKKTVAPKHPGGSFVLQSEFGFEANRILSENQQTMRIPEVVTDSSGNILYAECYLPEMYSDQIKSGEMIYYNSEEYNKMFGFRIPSSDLHSSVPLRVIGYYPSLMQDNVIVIPSAVTALHGSDFDVDKLFVVRYGVFGQEDQDLDPKNPDQTPEDPNVRKEYKTRFQKDNVTIAQKGIKYGFTAPEAIYDTKGNLTEFGNRHTEIFNIDGVIINEKEKTQDKILQLEKEMSDLGRQPVSNKAEKAKRTREWKAKNKEVEDLTRHLKTLRDIQKGHYSNTILSSVLDNISYSGENAEDIFFGITFDPVKGYEEDSEYSQLARVFSEINKAKGVEDLLPERPILYKTLTEAQDNNPDLYSDIKSELEDNLGVDTSTKEGQEDLLSLINEDLKEDWISERDNFIRRQRGSGSVNINKVEQHVTVHKETYMAAGLVGLIANFSKGLAYAFHGITDDKNHIDLDITENQIVEIDDQKFDKLTLSNKDGVKNQELRSLALNAAIDHVKEQILNVLNVGNKTTKIFLAAISTEMNLHQTSMLMLQPVAKELNSSNATTVGATLDKMSEILLEKLSESGTPLSDQEVNEIKVNTRDLEKLIQMDFDTLINDIYNTNYKKNLKLQYKVIKQLSTLNTIGNEISEISQTLSVIQGLPYSLEQAYDKLKSLSKFINIENFYKKLENKEGSEYTQSNFKDDLRSNKNILKNVNLANNENILGALEAIKTQVDVVSELFTENSIQAQFLVNNMIKSISDNSDPSTMFDNDPDMTFDTVQNMSVQDKYLKGKSTFNMFKMISRNIFNYLTTGLNISYNNNNHLFSLSVQDQKLLTVNVSNKRGDFEFTLEAVRSYIESFLMKEADIYTNNGNYKADNYIVSQINPEWRLKPLALIKKENGNNKFLRSLGIDTNFRDKIRIMTFNSSLANTAENLAEIEQSVNELNNLRNIYVVKDKAGNWVDLPSNQHPVTPEMSEIIFNILKTSLYTDKFKFGSSKATNVIPPSYYQNIFLELETLVKDLMYYNKSNSGNKYYKDFKNLDNQTNNKSALADIKENLFINTIFSIPTVLPNLSSVLPNKKEKFKHVFRQAGILNNGNIYDMYLDASILDKQASIDETQTNNLIESTDPTIENTNMEVTQDVSETEAENDLYEKFRKNPSFVIDEAYGKKGSYEVYMKVGSTGSKEAGDLKYYYKKINVVSGKITNNSFDTNLLLNTYKIKDYFNPKRLAIPVKNIDFSGDRIKLDNITISSFMVNAKDDLRTGNTSAIEIKNATERQFEYLRALPENSNKTDQQIRELIKTKVNVENVINSVNEVSLYNSFNIDRVGLRTFKILNRSISEDGSSVSLELEALPDSNQISFRKFDAPLQLSKTIRKPGMSREQKIEYINSIPGAKVITSDIAENMTDAQIDVEFDRATEIDENKEINQVLKDKSCG